ncbi:MAG: heavy metal translocating P-type ATPase [Vulcanimicrobiaceae bacterium]
MIDEIERDARALLEPPAHAAHGDDGHHTIDRRELARVAFVAVAAALVWFRVWEPFAGWSAIGVGATLAGGWPIFREAFEAVRERRMTMELSMTIALVAALAIGQAFTALVITGFVLAAEILEHLTVSRGREAIGDLLRYLPRTARVRRDGAIDDIAASDVRIGDAVLVDPGALVAVDGRVTGGHSFVDEANITGESMPVEKRPGSLAYAGTFNGNGALEIRAERIGRDTSFGRIIDAVESADATRAPIERLADRLAGYLVYFALGAAALTYAMTRDVVATISVIIVAGACGIAAGTPLAILGAVGRAARAGAIVKGGKFLEALASVTTIAFDKTGTLTYGAPDVVAVEPVAGVSEETLLRIAAIAERRSEHPLGTAIVAHALSRGMLVAEPTTFTYVPGRGIRATLDGGTIVVGNVAMLHEHAILGVRERHDAAATYVHVACDGRYLGAIAIADTVRPEAAAAIAALRAMGIRTVLLTGDVGNVARAVGAKLGFDEVVAGLLPEGKSTYVADLAGAGTIVAMVGDGVNDAPALARATIGVAMGSGTDVARESADIVLLGNDLGRFVDTVRIARATKAIVMQNFAGTIAIDTIGIALAAFGYLNPLLAAFIHVVSELAFILNSTRMLARRGADATGGRKRFSGYASPP